jgi:hypothetical protein
MSGPGNPSWFAKNQPGGPTNPATDDEADADDNNNSTNLKIKNIFLENKIGLKNNIFDLQVLTETITTADFEMLSEEEKEEIRGKILSRLYNFCSKINTSKILGNRMLKLSIGARYGWSGHGFMKERRF